MTTPAELEAIRDAAKLEMRAYLKANNKTTGDAFCELAAKTLITAAKRNAASATPAPDGTLPVPPAAGAGIGAAGEAFGEVGRAAAPETAATSKPTTKTKARPASRASSNTSGRSRTIPAGHAGRSER